MKLKMLPISEYQKRFFLEWVLDPDGCEYNESLVFKIVGNLDLNIFKRACEIFTVEHDVVYANYSKDGDICYRNDYKIDDFYKEITVDNNKNINHVISQKLSAPFDLYTEPLLRLYLLIHNGCHYFLVNPHHIIADAVFAEIITNQVAENYNLLVSGQDILPNRSKSFLDAVAAEQNNLNKNNIIEAKNFWENLLHEFPLTIGFYKRENKNSLAQNKKIFFDIDNVDLNNLKTLAKECRCTIFILMSAIYSLLLSKYSNQKKIVISYPVNMRMTGFANTVGCFVNNVPLAIELDNDIKFSDIIKNILNQRQNAKKHQWYPLTNIIQDQRKIRHEYNNNYFNVSFVEANLNASSMNLTSMDVEALDIHPNRSGIYDLNLLYDPRANNGIKFKFEYKESTFSDFVAEEFVDEIKHLVKNCNQIKDYSISEIISLRGNKVNETANPDLRGTSHLLNMTLHGLLMDIAQKYPDNIAVIDDKGSYDYKTISFYSHNIAQFLFQNKLSKVNSLIAVLCEKGYLQVVSTLGIMQSSSAYLPLNVDWPIARIDDVLLEGMVSSVLVSQQFFNTNIVNSHIENKYKWIIVEDILNSSTKKLIRPEINSKDIAYVIFTSGSTGKPKGVVISHRGAINTIVAINEKFDVNENDKVLALSELSFDLSVYDIFGTLAVGATVVFPEQEKTKEPDHWYELVNKYNITIWNTVPQLMQLLVDYATENNNGLNSLRAILMSGDWIPLKLPEQIKQINSRARVFSLGGATEGSIWSIWYEINEVNSEWSSIPYGFAMPNQSIYILNDYDTLSPVGVVGEVCIGGEGVALGYWNDTQKTNNSFINHKLLGRIYKTGDLGKLNENGYVEFIGRKDNQVKLNGYRVELGEISSKLQSIDGIDISLVLVKDNRLVAYIILQKILDSKVDTIIDLVDVKSQLSQLLPSYMVPESYMIIDKIPLTANGKVDISALPKEIQLAVNYVEPTNNIQVDLIDIWSKVLNIKPEVISIHDDFFQLGGDSISSIQISSKMRGKGYELRVKDIFDYKTVAKLAQKILNSKNLDTSNQYEQGVLTGEFKLLPIQQWFITRLESGDLKNYTHWNQSFLIKTPVLEIKKLNSAIQKLVVYHDALRLRFIICKSNNKIDVIQKYESSIKIPDLEILDVSNHSTVELSKIFTSWQSDFDLENGPLFKFAYLTGYTDGSARIYCAFHHMIVDAVSWRIITDDIRKLYLDQDLGAKGSSYRQWGNSLIKYQEIYKDEPTYWLSLVDSIMNTNYLLDSKFTHQNKPAESDIYLSIEFTDHLLKNANKAYNTEIKDLLITALGYSLQEITLSEVNYIAVEGHGRENFDDTIDHNHTIGWYTSIYPVKVELRESIAETIKYTKEYLRKIPNKGIGFGIFAANEECELDFKQLPKISFNYLGQFDENSNNWHITGEYSGINVDSANIDYNYININALIINKQLYIKINTSLGEDITAQLLQNFKRNLEFVSKYCEETYTANNQISIYTPSDFTYSNLSLELLDKLQIDAKANNNELEYIYRANSLQQGFIYHAISQEKDDAYRVQILFDYNNKLDLDKYIEAWGLVIEEYPILRTAFNYEEDIIQIIYKYGNLNYEIHDISDLKTQESKDKKIEEIQRRDREKGFDITKPTLLRLHIIKQTEDYYTILKTEHHSIADGWSGPILLNRVHEYYMNLFNHKLSDKTKSKDFILDRAYIDTQEYISSNLEEANKYWQEEKKYIEESNDIRVLFSRRIDLNSFKEITIPKESLLEISGNNYHKLKDISQELGVTINVLLQFAWHKLLQVYIDTNKTIVGTTISGRDLPINGIENSVGLYINTLPLIIDWNNDNTIEEQLNKIQSKISEINSHSFADLSKLQLNGNRLFHSLVVFENYPVPDSSNDNREEVLKLCLRNVIEKVDYPLCVIANEHNNKLIIRLKYDGDYLDESMAKKHLDKLCLILEQIIKNKDLKHKEISLLSQSEYQKIVYDWNKTERDYPKNKTIHQLFEEQVERNPNNIALVYEDAELSYEELNAKANQLATYIRENYKYRTREELNPDTLIALCLDRSIEIVVGILATLKAGGAYVPIDPNYPEDRINYILEDTATKLILTQEHIQKTKTYLVEDNVVSIDLHNKDIYKAGNSKLAKESRLNLQCYSQSSNLAYVIYTSGTTGTPKGAMIEHKSVVNLVLANDNINVTSNDVFGLFASTVFDAVTFEIWSPLLSSAKLFIPSDINIVFEPNYFEITLLKNKINVLWLTKTVFDSILLSKNTLFKSLKYLLVGGEQLDPKIVSKLINSRYKPSYLLNGYGPTESTTFTSMYNLNNYQDRSIISIGKPLSNIKTYILDQNSQPVPIGIIGELYIGGAGLARGYLNRPDLTKERFIANPFASEEDIFNGYTRLYKTGDLCRYLEDGNIEYIGRNDDQVKIRGYRIELGEIENALSGIFGIKQACVLAKTRNDVINNSESSSSNAGDSISQSSNKYLVGYYVLDKTAKTVEESKSNQDKSRLGKVKAQRLTEDEILLQLSSKLPEYTVPSYLIELEEFPLTINGKLDKKALPEPEHKVTDSYAAPITDLEKELIKVWSNVLGIEEDKIGIHDDFFRLGGNSILAIQLASRINKATNLEIKVSDIFRYKTIANIDSNLVANKQVVIPHIESNKADLSYAQERLWFIEKYEEGSNAYHIPYLSKLKAGINIEHLKESLNSIVRRHEILRTTIKELDNEHYQLVNKEELQIEGRLIPKELSEEDLREIIKSDINKVFRLDNEYPIRVILYRRELSEGLSNSDRNDKEHITNNSKTKSNSKNNIINNKEEIYLLIVMHHIASDGWSIEILQRELLENYNAQIENREAIYPKLSIQYKDYAVWQKEYLKEDGDIYKEQLSYWKNKLEDYKTLEFPTDYARPKEINYSGEDVNFKLSKGVSNKLRELARSRGVTLYSLMLSSFSILLSKYSNQEDIIVGSPIANRHHIQTEDLIGFFVNTQVHRSILIKDQSFNDLIDIVHRDQIEAQLHQDLPFEKLVDELNVERDSSRSPIFQIMFGVQSFGRSDANSEALKDKSRNKSNSQVELKLKDILETASLPDIYKIAKFDLTFMLDDGGEEIVGNINYATSLFKKERIERLQEHYIKILERLLENPEQKHSEINILSKAEYQQIVYDWNKTEIDYPRDKTIQELFEEQVKRTPDNVALVFDGQELTYKKLNEKANQLARHIRKEYKNRAKEELEPDTLIALCLDRSLEMIVGILATLKAGAAYVPMDREYPQDRIDYILEDTKAQLILTQDWARSNLVSKFDSISLTDTDIKIKPKIYLPKDKVIEIDLSNKAIYLAGNSPEIEESKNNLPLQSQSQDLAYVIYTSGTTGKPKGVLQIHSNVVRLFSSTDNKFNFNDRDVWTLFHSYVFDFTVWELWGALTYGGTLLLPTIDEVKDFEIFYKLCLNYKVTVLNQTPSAFYKLLEIISENKDTRLILKSLRYVIFGGEALSSGKLSSWWKYCQEHNLQTKLINMYGITETTVHVTYKELSEREDVDSNIGRPISDLKSYILDKNMQPSPIGVAGELYVGGAGLARGYLNLPELTKERFVINPFATEKDVANGYTRLYKTGDLCKYLIDGNIEYLGRNDDQVKIRGYRIELGEIENALSKIDGIKQSCVLVKTNVTGSGENKYLVGYYVLSKDVVLEEAAIYTNLLGSLPEYMMPSYLVKIEKFPLTINGKLDKKSLPEPEARSSSEYVAPRNELENEMCRIWGEVLGIDSSKIGINDDFFRLGGNSILAVQVSHKLNINLSTKIKVADIFIKKNIGNLSKHLLLNESKNHQLSSDNVEWVL